MKINYKKGEQDLENKVEILYDRMFRKWYSGNDKLFHYSKIYSAPRGSENIKSLIRSLLRAGADVRTGYICSSIRGSHDYYIFETGFSD